MTDSGRLDPEPPEDGSHDGDYAAWALLDSVDLARQPDEALDTILREIAPGAPHDTAGERAAQIEVDRRIVVRVAAEGFKGPDTRKLLLAAFEYAHPVMGYLIGTGRIFRECARLRRPVNRQPGDVRWTDDDRTFLAESCVDAGIFDLFYEHGLKKYKWDPRRGTALTTYAVNACILCFPPVYKKWCRTRALERSFGDLAVDLPALIQVDLRQPDPAERAANRVDAERLLLKIPEPARSALWLRGALDATQAEAAALVGLTEKALESRIGRARVKLGLARGGPPRPDQERTSAPGPDAGLDAQEGDHDR